MQLSEVEKKGIQLEGGDEEKSNPGLIRAICKVMSEKPVWEDLVAQSSGKIWCPLKGIGCKDLGENKFLITFYQISGKKKALEEGPWMMPNKKDLVVVVDFDGAKRIDEMEFCQIPIWVRVTKMLLGLMNKTMGLAIGKKIGVVIDRGGGRGSNSTKVLETESPV